ncbi:Beta-galactosidase [bacterium HR21]|nr:Beta-galactosidase [bacterium HR21]
MKLHKHLRWGITLGAVLLCHAGIVDAMPHRWLQRWLIPLEGTWEMSTDGGETWATVRLPHIASGSQVRYRRVITMESAALAYRWHLSTFGLGDIADIYLNGTHAGQLISYGLPTSVVLPTSLWRVGTNVLELRITRASLPVSFFGPRRPLGCFRELTLMGTDPRSWLHGIEASATVDPGGRQGRLTLLVGISGQADTHTPYVLRVRLVRARDSLPVADQLIPIARLPQRIRTQLEVLAPELWSPEAPALYTLRIELVQGSTLLDGALLSVGFRSVEVIRSGEALSLAWNGKPVPLYGVEYSTVSSSAELDRELSRLIALGIRAVRFRGLPPHPLWLQACSRTGISVILDMPATEIPPSQLWSPAFRFALQHYRQLLTPLLTYPAVTAITAWQGLYPHPATTAYVDELQRWLRGRNLLLAAELYGNPPQAEFPQLPLLFLRFHPPLTNSPPEAEQERWKTYARSHALIPVGGMPVVATAPRGYLNPYSEEARAQWLWRFLTTCAAARTAGALLWSWQDYPTEYPLISFSFPATEFCPTGISSLRDEVRPAYAVVDAFLHGEPEPILAPGNPGWGPFPMWIALGSGVLLLFGWILNRSPNLRQQLGRALWRSTAFFTDLRERRAADERTTLLCGGALAAVVAIFGALLHEWLRTQPPWVILLWHFLPFDELRQLVAWVLTRRWALLIGCALVWGISLSIGAGVLSIGARLVRRHLAWSVGLQALVWASLPLLFLLPLLLLGERLVELHVLRAVTLTLVGLALGWSFWRVLSALRSLLQLRLRSLFLAVLWIGLLAGTLLFGVAELTFSLSAYLRYAATLWGIP